MSGAGPVEINRKKVLPGDLTSMLPGVGDVRERKVLDYIAGNPDRVVTREKLAELLGFTEEQAAERFPGRISFEE